LAKINIIVGIGTDIIKIARFEEMTDHFMARVFTSNERAYILKKGHISAAGIFAAKEAVVKALGTGFRGFWPSDVEITHDDLGKPHVILHGGAARVAHKMIIGKHRFKRKCVIQLSISHTETDAIAFAVVFAK